MTITIDLPPDVEESVKTQAAKVPRFSHQARKGPIARMYDSRVLEFLMLAVKNSKKRSVALRPSLVMMTGSAGALSGEMTVKTWLMIRAAPVWVALATASNA